MKETMKEREVEMSYKDDIPKKFQTIFNIEQYNEYLKLDKMSGTFLLPYTYSSEIEKNKVLNNHEKQMVLSKLFKLS